MKAFLGVERLEPPPYGSAVTIGTFDGVHTGHRALIATTVGAARERGLASVVLTWDRHPAATLRPDAVPPMLSSPERKSELLSGTGADYLVVLPFDKELASQPPEVFVEDVLVTRLGARAVFVGRGWRFGHKAVGTVELLEALGRELGFEAHGIALEQIAGGAVSSSRVRKAVTSGDMALARNLLGRPFDLDGAVQHGDDRGAALGYPTANLAIDPSIASPPRGVYAGRARVGESWWPAATNIGVNPTFGGDPERDRPRIETYLIDFAGDLYGSSVRVEFWERLRDEQRFASAEELVAQMARDVEATRRLTC